jgi:hypothetical protein
VILTAGAAVLELHVELGKSVALEDRSVAHITLATSLDDIPDLKSLDRLVLRHTASTVGASDDRGVTTTLLAASVIASLLGHPVTRKVRLSQYQNLETKAIVQPECTRVE